MGKKYRVFKNMAHFARWLKNEAMEAVAMEAETLRSMKTFLMKLKRYYFVCYLNAYVVEFYTSS